MIEIGIDPVAFAIGNVEIRWYGIFIALAIISIIIWLLWQVRKGAKLSYDTIFTAALVGIPSGIIIARVLHVVDNIVIAKLHPELALAGYVIDYTQYPGQIVGGDGLTAYGAVLGASLGIWIYCRIAKIRIGYLFDVLAPATILAQAIGRIGCTFNGCCYGLETTLPWGIEYTNPNSFGIGAGIVHPTQIYEIIYNLIVFGILVKLRGKVKPDGSLFLIYLGLYSVWRIGIDFIREGNPFLFGLHQAQVIGIIVLVIVIPALIYRAKKAKEQIEISPDEEDEVEEQLPVE